MNRCPLLFGFLLTALAVLPAGAEPAVASDQDVLLFTYFRDNGQAGVFLAQSADGTAFTPLNGDRPVFTPPKWPGQDLTRDASILYREGVFRMVWTSHWKGRVFGYAESRDLVTWSEPRQIRPFPESLPAADQPDNIWAPELHWDPFKRDFFVLFSSTTPRERTDGDGSDNKGNNTSPYDNRIFITRTTDGRVFSPARLFFDQGFSGIDAVMRVDEKNARWVMVVKCSRDPGVTPLPGRNLRLTFTGPDLDQPNFTPVSAPIAGTHSPMFSHPDALKSMAEGQSLLRYRDQWWLYWDEPAGHGMQLGISSDLVTWTHVKSFTFPAGAKHGTAFLAPRAAVGWLKPTASLDLGARVQPAPLEARFSDPDWHIWCGAPIRGDDGKYHLLYSRWPVAKGFAPGWALHSEIAYAVADRPLGPYKFVNVALPPRGVNPATGEKFWDGDVTHNPNLLRHPNGKFYLFYMGEYGDGKDYPMHRNHQRIGVAVADSPAGPWRRFDRPIVDVSADPTAFDSLCVTNPAAAVRPDGGILLLYKAVQIIAGKPMGGNVRYGAALATKPEGPYVKTPGRIFEPESPTTTPHWMFAEDPFVWFSAQEGNRYYAVARDVVGQFTGAKGGLALFQSDDGLKWRAADQPKVLGAKFAWADGSLSNANVERPALLFDERGRPIALFGATDGYRKDGRTSFNVHFPLTPPP